MTTETPAPTSLLSCALIAGLVLGGALLAAAAPAVAGSPDAAVVPQPAAGSCVVSVEAAQLEADLGADLQGMFPSLHCADLCTPETDCCQLCALPIPPGGGPPVGSVITCGEFGVCDTSGPLCF